VVSYEKYAALRDAAGLNNNQVAKEAKMDASILTYWKNKRSSPKIPKLLAIAKVLGCTLEDFIDIEEVDV
jgi:transcriptional regulator with XRE-family HTH domain